MITIAIDPAEIEAGARGVATVHLDAHATGTARLVVEFGWRTEGRGDPDSAVVHNVELSPDGAPGSPATARVEFEVPAGGPISYDGKIIRIIWEIRVRALENGKDHTYVEAFRVSPRRVTA